MYDSYLKIVQMYYIFAPFCILLTLYTNFLVNRNKESTQEIPSVSCLFGKHCFYIGSDMSLSRREKIKQCVDSFQWRIFEELSNKVEFAITDDEDIAKDITSKFPKIKAVKSDWIWKCSDEDSFVSPQGFLIP